MPCLCSRGYAPLHACARAEMAHAMPSARCSMTPAMPVMAREWPMSRKARAPLCSQTPVTHAMPNIRTTMPGSRTTTPGRMCALMTRIISTNNISRVTMIITLLLMMNTFRRSTSSVSKEDAARGRCGQLRRLRLRVLREPRTLVPHRALEPLLRTASCRDLVHLLARDAVRGLLLGVRLRHDRFPLRTPSALRRAAPLASSS